MLVYCSELPSATVSKHIPHERLIKEILCTVVRHCERREGLQQHHTDFQPPATRCGEFLWSVFLHRPLPSSYQARIDGLPREDFPYFYRKCRRNVTTDFHEIQHAELLSRPERHFTLSQASRMRRWLQSCAKLNFLSWCVHVVCVSKQRIPWTSC